MTEYICCNYTYGIVFFLQPDPGLHSRPDRILVSKTGLRVSSVFTVGGGEYYAKNYKEKLYWSRLAKVKSVAQSMVDGVTYESFCDWDCGPHGMCICGICVPTKENNACDSSYCESCSALKLGQFQLLLGCFIAVMVLLTFSILVILLKLARTHIRARICDSFKRSFIGKKYFPVAMIVCILVIYYTAKVVLKDTFDLVNSQIEEELFPSDHLMVVAKVVVG